MRALCRPTAAAALLLLVLLLAACTISSDRPLLADGEGAAPLPDAFAFFPYQAAADGYVRSSDPPASFEHEGDRYVARNVPDMRGELDVRLVPVGDETYLLAATGTGEPGTLYGFARYADSVLSIALAPDRQTAAAIARERRHGMPRAHKALAGLTVEQETGAIVVRRRAALDYLAEMYLAGRLPMDTLSVGYLAPDADAVPPSRLIPNGRDWMRVP